MSDRDEILQTNALFYEAFAACDVASMDEIWAMHAPVMCIHPGWSELVGRDAVMTSWFSILGQSEQLDVAFEDARAFLFGEIALVICTEIVGQAYLVATNTYVRERGEWKMVHHQAGPLPSRVASRPRDVDDGDDTLLH
tara:strand:+ start:1641 stop:2057 length:417 start_codon:yes stop_codon:yes gene_type:complete